MGATFCGQRLDGPSETPATRLRLLADDLTGALDSAVFFATLAAPIAVTWRPCVTGGSVAIDTGTHELDAAAARRRVAEQVAAC